MSEDYTELDEQLDSLQRSIDARMNELSALECSNRLLRLRLRRLVQRVGEPSLCTVCESPVLRVTYADGSRVAYDRDGAEHADACPKF